MLKSSKHIISSSATFKDAVSAIDEISKMPKEVLCIFVVDDDGVVLGSITDGDIRRALVKGCELSGSVENVINKNFHYLQEGDLDVHKIKKFKDIKLKVVPLVDKGGKIKEFLDFSEQKAILPMDAVIMAGGKGLRLRPFTENIPKPLLKLGDKTLIEHNIDNMNKFGIKDFHVSINYLGEQIENHLNNIKGKNVNFNFIKEEEPLGTAGAISLIDKFENSHVLIANSDIITNINYEDFYLSFLKNDSDLMIASTQYTRNVPYAVFETYENKILSYKEKPSFNYISNAGIYIVKKEVLDLIPKGEFFNMTDLLDVALEKGLKVNYYLIYGYWLDVGNMEDFAKAQSDINRISF